MGEATTTRHRRDRWPAVVFVLHLGHSLWFASRYPHSIWDPDLVAYFAYFRDWITGAAALQRLDYFTVPKPLLVFVLGPLGDAAPAFALSALVAAALGTLLYLIARDAFGRPTAIVAAIVLLLDVDRAVLTLRSSADLYVAALLSAAIWSSLRGRSRCSAFAIALATLVKPVAAPCALHLLAVDGPGRGRARRAAALSLLALPLVAVANQALLGSPAGAPRFFAAFDAYHQGAVLSGPDLVHFVCWVQMKQVIFGSTAAFGLLGLIAWCAADRRRLAHPLLLVPAALLGGYVGLSLAVPFVPMSRFFWPLEVWFLGFLVWGMLETARRLAPARPWARVAIAALLIAFLADDLVTRQLEYRQRATAPFETAMAFVQGATPALAASRRPGETVLTSLAFLPWFVWTLDDAARRPGLVRTGMAAGGDLDGPRPDWIVYAPTVFLNGDIRARFDTLLATGEYEPRIADGAAAIFARRADPGAFDWRAAATP